MNTTQSSLLIMGCVSLIAAVVGGNLKLPSTEFGKLESPLLRAALGSLGIGLIVTSFFLPTLTRNRPLKGEYLARLDARCTGLTTAATMPDLSAHLSQWRKFSDEWHGWPTPQGDDETVAELQKRFVQTINEIESIQPLYDRTFKDPVTQFLQLEGQSLTLDQLFQQSMLGMIDIDTLGKLTDQLKSTSGEYIEAMRDYGSTPCSNLVTPASVVAIVVHANLMDIARGIKP